MTNKTDATPMQTLQIHDLGDNARTDFDAQYPILLVAKDSYHNWAEEVPTEEFIIARFQRYDEARSILEAVNAHDELIAIARKHYPTGGKSHDDTCISLRNVPYECNCDTGKIREIISKAEGK